MITAIATEDTISVHVDDRVADTESLPVTAHPGARRVAIVNTLIRMGYRPARGQDELAERFDVELLPVTFEGFYDSRFPDRVEIYADHRVYGRHLAGEITGVTGLDDATDMLRRRGWHTLAPWSESSSSHRNRRCFDTDLRPNPDVRVNIPAQWLTGRGDERTS